MRRLVPLILLFLLWPFQARALPPVEVHFIDVGQGDAVLIKGSEGVNVLIDTGNLSAGHRVGKYLKEQGIICLKALVITHMHPDHVGGIFGILPDIWAEKIFDNGAKPRNSEFWHEYLNLVNDLRLERETLEAGIVFLMRI